MPPHDRRGSAVLAFLVDAMAHGVTAVPFARAADVAHRARGEEGVREPHADRDAALRGGKEGPREPMLATRATCLRSTRGEES